MPATVPLPDDLRHRLVQREHWLGAVAAGLDGLSPAAWTDRLPGDLAKRIAPGGQAASVLESLCWWRDEEAYVVGRRFVQLFQESTPAFDHLTRDLAEAAAPRPYAEESPARVFSELLKTRYAWLAVARGEWPTMAARAGTLPPEEGVGTLGAADHLAWVEQRDAGIVQALAALRAHLGLPAPAGAMQPFALRHKPDAP